MDYSDDPEKAMNQFIRECHSDDRQDARMAKLAGEKPSAPAVTYSETSFPPTGFQALPDELPGLLPVVNDSSTPPNDPDPDPAPDPYYYSDDGTEADADFTPLGGDLLE